MFGNLGEYEVKVDAKGRLRIPSDLLDGMGEGEGSFVINRGLENCLNLYPKKDWEILRQKVDKLNSFNVKHRKFQRYFYRGATEVSLDSAGRVLIKKLLLEHAKIDRDAIMAVVTGRLEIWSKENYLMHFDEDPSDLIDLANEVSADLPDLNSL